ncbi:unnamed protein product [Amoebophrya sp. A25]|nr:unnamed protein product [Amoebophrya sp. A25]|eukprot:GSA25T00006785001.1
MSEGSRGNSGTATPNRTSEGMDVRIRRARQIDVEGVYHLVNLAYSVEVGKEGSAFRKQNRYLESDLVAGEIQLAREEENCALFLVATERLAHRLRKKLADAQAAASSAAASPASSSVVKSVANAIGGLVKGKAAEDSNASQENDKMTKSESTNTLASTGSQSPGQSTPGGTREVIVGCVRIVLRKFGNDKCIDVGPFAVLPVHQRKGIGKMLLNAAYDWAWKRHVRRVIVEVCSVRTDLFVPRPGSKDDYIGITDPRGADVKNKKKASTTLPAIGGSPKTLLKAETPNKKGLPWTQATSEPSAATPPPPPTTGGAGNNKPPAPVKDVKESPTAKGNGSNGTKNRTSASASPNSKDVPPKVKDRITSKDIASEARLYPDIRRPVPGSGYFGKLGYLQVGTIGPDDVLDPDPGTTSRPDVHFYLLSRKIAAPS